MNRVLDPVLALAERSVTVSDLVCGRALWCVHPSARAITAAREMRQRSFDVAPLREQPVNRFLLAADAAGHTGTVSDAASPIEVGLVVSSALPLADAVARLGSQEFLFVLEGDRVTQVLTRADLQLPPVALVALGFVTAAEAGLDQLIARALGDTWPDLISAERRARLEEVFAARQEHNTEIGLLQCLNLDDRLTIAAKTEAIWRAVGAHGRREFEDRTKPLKELRNTLAHGGGLLDAEPDPERAVGLFAAARAFAEAAWDDVAHDDADFGPFTYASEDLLAPTPLG